MDDLGGKLTINIHISACPQAAVPNIGRSKDRNIPFHHLLHANQALLENHPVCQETRSNWQFWSDSPVTQEKIPVYISCRILVWCITWLTYIYRKNHPNVAKFIHGSYGYVHRRQRQNPAVLDALIHIKFTSVFVHGKSGRGDGN